VGGLLVAGALAVWVPPEFGQSFFAVDHPPLAGQGASIIVTASISGKGHAGLGIYSATKGGDPQSGQDMVLDIKGRGIRVNATQEPSRTRSERLGSVRWRHSGGS
jgi:NAD(P)-dependent dehydrogenase (short-subunit alcohol dehydrogenase family)